ncbi:MAG: class I SAM-dependent methyltransferase [Clostridiales bacterium]|nr:class I SAM-dependent methyltransferase [Clostridiales bacterium]
MDFGHGFGEYLFAAANAFPEGEIIGVDRNPVCNKEVSQKISDRNITNITLIEKEMYNLSEFKDDSFDLVILYDIMHGGDGKLKYMLLEESKRVLKPNGCLTILPVHLSNWRDREGKTKTYTSKMIITELSEYGFEFVGTCKTKGVHWEKCHTLYYIQKKIITMDVLERVDVMNFKKGSIV